MRKSDRPYARNPNPGPFCAVNLAARIHSLAPELSIAALGLVNRLLPHGSEWTESGAESRVLEKSWMRALTTLGRKAAYSRRRLKARSIGGRIDRGSPPDRKADLLRNPHAFCNDGARGGTRTRTPVAGKRILRPISMPFEATRRGQLVDFPETVTPGHRLEFPGGGHTTGHTSFSPNPTVVEH